MRTLISSGMPGGFAVYECDECGTRWPTAEDADYCAAEDMAELDEQEDPA